MTLAALIASSTLPMGTSESLSASATLGVTIRASGRRCLLRALTKFPSESSPPDAATMTGSTITLRPYSRTFSATASTISAL